MALRAAASDPLAGLAWPDPARFFPANVAAADGAAA
jgi:hypothetical protein